jgi:hypothetical protein
LVAADLEICGVKGLAAAVADHLVNLEISIPIPSGLADAMPIRAMQHSCVVPIQILDHSIHTNI